jgi:phosphoribosylformimino-5-aminoimidazole carboxamide ribotide isomerase
MLIPSIDLKAGQVVQLVQGRDLAIPSDDVFAWVRRFEGFPKVQVIDLDGAFDSGANDFLVRRICRALPCRVGGGIRTIERARAVRAAGAQAVIVGSSLFSRGTPNLMFAQQLAEAVGIDRVIAAVDSLQGRVVIKGWREATDLSAVEAVRLLEPYCGEFLYTHVDAEGLMKGTDVGAIRAVREATTRRVTAAGGITTQAEIDALDAMGVDAVVGMAIYTGTLAFKAPAGR